MVELTQLKVKNEEASVLVVFWPFLPFKLSDVSPSQAAQLARERAAELQKLQETAEQAEACCLHAFVQVSGHAAPCCSELICPADSF